MMVHHTHTFTGAEWAAIKESLSQIQGFLQLYDANPDINHINEICTNGEILYRICLQPLGRFFDRVL
jgi:hypothetical protein